MRDIDLGPRTEGITPSQTATFAPGVGVHFVDDPFRMEYVVIEGTGSLIEGVYEEGGTEVIWREEREVHAGETFEVGGDIHAIFRNKGETDLVLGLPAEAAKTPGR